MDWLAVYQSEMTFQRLPSHCYTRPTRAPSWSEQEILSGFNMPSKPSSLRRASERLRFSRPQRTGLRTPEIEEAREAAWVAISALANALKEEGFAGPTIWKAALKATELDRIVDLRSRCPRSERPLFGVSAYPVMTGIEEIHVLFSNHL